VTSPLERIRSEAPRVLKFGAVGIVATAIHTTVALVALPIAGSPFLANLAGFLTAFVFSFLGQALWTFRLTRGRRAAAVRFFAVSGGSFLFSNLVLGAAKASGLLPNWASLLIAIAVIPPCNYVASRLWAFRAP
jgi:putative flippase GtrA